MQFVIFTATKIIILRGYGASPRISFTNERHIIAANHRSGLDPFAIVSSLRVRDFFALAPFSFMTANRFMRPLWLRPIAWAAGCFPAHPGLGAHGIDKAVSDLNAGYTLVIFPEGRRTKDPSVKAKRGLASIREQVPGARLILTHIEWRRTASIQQIHMNYPPKDTALHTSDEVMEAIYKL